MAPLEPAERPICAVLPIGNGRAGALLEIGMIVAAATLRWRQKSAFAHRSLETHFSGAGECGPRARNFAAVAAAAGGASIFYIDASARDHHLALRGELEAGGGKLEASGRVLNLAPGRRARGRPRSWLASESASLGERRKSFAQGKSVATSNLYASACL